MNFITRAQSSVLSMLICLCLLPFIMASAATNQNQVTEKCWAVARLKYGGGGDWYSGPTMLPNLQKRLQRELNLSVCSDEKVIGLLDGNLYDYSILFMTGHGNVEFSEAERSILREYLLRGGLLFADDNYGLDTSFRREMKILFPNHSLKPMTNQHPVFKSHFKFLNGLPKIHEHDGKRATAFGIDIEGRTVVFYSYECDLGNGWEDLETYKDPAELHESALKMGVNVVAWFLQGAPPEKQTTGPKQPIAGTEP